MNGTDLPVGCPETNPDAGVCKYKIQNTIFNSEFTAPGGITSYTGYDPGRDLDIDCGEDINSDFTNGDIDFQEDALTALENQNIRLLHIDSSGQKAIFAPYWSTWTRGTNGAYVPINSDGKIPQGLDLRGLILRFVRQIASTPGTFVPGMCDDPYS